MMNRSPLIMVALAAALLFPATVRAASVSIEASAEPSVVNVGGSTTLEMRAQVDGNHRMQLIEKPDVGSAFRIVGTSRRPQLHVRNGNAQRSLTVRYQLRAMEEGTFEIPVGAIQIGDETYAPDPQKIRVVPSGASSSRNDDETNSQARSKDGNVIVDTSIEPTRQSYLGQQITLVYSLMANPHKTNVQPRPPDDPSLDNFWIEELSRDLAGNTETTRVDGRLMEKTILRAYALFPLQSGTVTIDPLSVKVRTGGFFSRTSTLDMQTDPVELDVRPLPPDPPEGFYEGNVGDWSFRVDVDQDDVAVGDAVTVELRASGSGNVRRLDLPPLEDHVDGFHVNNRSEEVDKEFRGTRVTGRKTVTYSLIPTREGRLEIPSLSFSYFDPDAEAYKTIESRSRRVVVSGGALPDSLREDGDAEDDDVPVDRDPAEKLRDRLQDPIRERGDLRSSISRSERLAFYIGAGLPLGGLVIVLVVWPLASRLRGSDTTRRRRGAIREARARLDEAFDLPDDEAVDAIYAALRLALVDGLDLPAGALSPGELEEHLRRVDCPDSLRERLTASLQWCEDRRYAPSSELDHETVDNWVAETRDALDELGQACDSGALSSLATVGTILVAVALVGIAAPLPAVAEEAPEAADTFDTALQAHDDQQWSEAADAWKRDLDDNPDDPVSLHNLAVSLVQSDRLGAARVAMERAARLAPRHDEIRAKTDALRRLIEIRRIERSRALKSAPAAERDLGWWRMATSVSSRSFAIGILIALWLLFFGAAGRRFATADRSRFLAAAAVTVGLVGLLAVGAAWTAHRQILTSTDAVVVTDTQPPRQAPSRHAETRDLSPPLIDGAMVRARERREGWIQFQTPDGENAWLPESAATSVP